MQGKIPHKTFNSIQFNSFQFNFICIATYHSKVLHIENKTEETLTPPRRARTFPTAASPPAENAQNPQWRRPPSEEDWSLNKIQ